MDYFRLSIIIDNDLLQSPYKDICIDALAALGFESFEEEDSQINAYVAVDLYDADLARQCIAEYFPKFTLEESFIKDENWNKVWESNYSPVSFGDFCFVHAPFHKKEEGVRFNIEIEPKMSFGTAHHPTTSLIIEYLKDDYLDSGLNGKATLDMGCGTAVLAILAKKLGASKVVGVDNDIWAYENSLENVARNNVSDIEIIHGDAAALKGREFDIIIANINRNILLRDISYYAQTMQVGSLIYFSGFYKQDMQAIEAEANENRLFYVSHKENGDWVALKFIMK